MLWLHLWRLRSLTPLKRLRAIAGLERSRHRRAIGPLLRAAATDPDADVRLHARSALYGYMERLASLPEARAEVPYLLEAYPAVAKRRRDEESDPGGPSAAALATFLAEIGDPRAASVVLAEFSAWNASHVDAAGKWRLAGTVPRLIESLWRNGRCTASDSFESALGGSQIRALALIGDRRAIPALVTCLTQYREEGVVAAAEQALAAIDPQWDRSSEVPAAVANLLQIVADRVWREGQGNDLEGQAARRLLDRLAPGWTKANAARLVSTLVPALEKSSSDGAGTGGQRRVEALLDAADPGWRLSDQAQRAVRSLVGRLEEPAGPSANGDWTRQVIVGALGVFAAPQAVPSLVGAVQDAGTAEAAIRSLVKTLRQAAPRAAEADLVSVVALPEEVPQRSWDWCGEAAYATTHQAPCAGAVRLARQELAAREKRLAEKSGGE
jgi:hypothetical protein